MTIRCLVALCLLIPSWAFAQADAGVLGRAVGQSGAPSTPPSPPPASLRVDLPSWSIHANAADDVAITTASAYLGNATGKVTALTRANNAGTDHHDLTIKWSDLCTTAASSSCTWTRIDEIVDNTTQPLVLNIAPVWDDGTKTVPAALSAVAFDHSSMVTAYTDMLTALVSHVDRRLWMLGVGYEADVYFAANPSTVTAFGAFLGAVRTHARTQFGTNPFVVTVNFRSSAAATLLDTYSVITNLTDVESFTYYPTATSDASVLLAAVVSDVIAIKQNIGTANPVYFQEIGLTTDSPSSESLQLIAFLGVRNAIAQVATSFPNSVLGATWYQLSDVSAAVRTSFGATSYGKRASIGQRDTANVAKDAWPVVITHLGGRDTDPPDPPDPPDPQPPDPVNLISPQNGATGLGTSVLLEWESQLNATYQLWLGPVGGSFTRTDLTTAQWQVVLPAGVSREWYVVVCNPVACKTSPTWTFTLAAAAPAPANLTILSPLTGATNVDVTPTLAWSADFATSYRVRLGTTNPPTTEICATTATTCTPTALSNNTLYRWEVDAINTVGTITVSGSFTTEAAAPAATHPVLLINATRTTTWTTMKADYDGDTTCLTYTGNQQVSCVLYKAVIDNSNSLVKGYFNFGLDDAWLANVPGNNAATYCGRAWDRSLDDENGFLSFASGADIGPNPHREWMTDWTLIYDWCYASWTSAQRDRYLTQLNGLAANVIQRYGSPASNAGTGWWCGDVDNPIGNYFGIALLYYATKDYNPTIVDLWADDDLGGLTASALICKPQTSPSRTLRNMIAQYYGTHAAGGAWMEGAEYAATAFIGVFGCEALRTTSAGSTACTEIDGWIDDWATYLTHSITRDYKAIAQYGDVEDGHVWLSIFTETYAHWMPTLSGLLPDGAIRQHMWRQYLNFRSTNGMALSEPFWAVRAAAMANPAITAAADLSALSSCYQGSGFGLHLFNDGVLTTSSQFANLYRVEGRELDHFIDTWGDIQLYRRGQWALTHPHSYAGVTILPEGSNTVALEGLSPPPTNFFRNGQSLQYRRVNGYTCGADYLYTAGTTGGLRHPPTTVDGTGNYFDPPPPYVHEYTRSTVYLPSASTTYDSIVVIDRVNAVDPEALAKFTRYPSQTCWLTTCPTNYSADQQRIQAAPRWTSYLHQWTPALVEPTVSGARTTWTLTDGQLLQDDWLSPDAVTITKENTALLSAFANITTHASERGWRTRVEPTSNTQWNVLMRVITARNAGTAAPTITELTPTNNAVGVQITRTGNDDRVVVANGAQGADITQATPTAAQATAVLETARYRAAGSFTFTYTQTTASAKALLLDLNPALTWTYTVNGGAPIAITEDSSGFEELTISTAEAKTIVVTGS